MRNDWAVVEVNSRFDFTSTVEPAQIMTLGQLHDNVTEGTLVGFGCTFEEARNNFSCNHDTFLEVKLTIARGQSCRRPVVNIGRTQLCTVSSLAGGCEGDSGSPIFWEN